ncbi:glycoside hydrolase family 3 protein [Pengzhenrongella phosphoraccumulans]|uniref:glycoside hydrolase family 3 protein n=1 Tax=Pengzhenrongella phosphoraccumulans TaxID=3114394 RepID=UPI00388D0843
MTHLEAVTQAMAKLSIEEKVRLLTGATAWSLHSLETIRLRSVVVSDGPVGVRGVRDDPADWSLLFPAPSALAATWDVQAARRLGDLFATEARRKGIDVILAPVVNLQRTPVGGRHFECFSEDPVLTGNIATALIGAIQSHGIGVCLKHFLANDSETERTSYIARMDERTLREVYLAPFEQAVREASPWSIMAAYNGIDTGIEASPATEHHHLLVEILKEEWGYDGAVISDWLAATSTVGAALGGLDLVMPGPGGPWEDRLTAQVRTGAVPESVIDDKVRRLLRLAERVGAWSPGQTREPVAARPVHADVADAATEALTRLAAQATVVLSNSLPNGAALIPVDPHTIRSVALIGPGAVAPFVQGGGSAHVNPHHVVTPVQGLRALLPDDVTISVHRGGIATAQAPALDLAARATDPVTGSPGLRIEILDALGEILDAWTECEGWDGRPALGDRYPSADHLHLFANVTLTEPGVHRIGIGTVGQYSIRIDGQVTAKGDHRVGAEVILNSSVNEPQEIPALIDVVNPRVIKIDATVQVIDGQAYGRFARAAIRHLRPGLSVSEEITEAVEAARTADLAIIVVGTNLESESEGWDRTTLALPGRQDELVRRVSAANPRTVVFVNAGAPVILPWLDAASADNTAAEDGARPAATLWWWLPGQEAGHALAGTIFGAFEPAGRLPWTLPAREADVPVPAATPVHGYLDYTEGVNVGYRSWDVLGRAPARPFGFGLGWGDWTYGPLEIIDRSEAGVTVRVELHNAAPRPSSEVVQVYLDVLEHHDGLCFAEASGGCDGRCLTPVGARRLGGHVVVSAAAESDATATILLPRRVFERWDTGAHSWAPAGTHFRLHAARNVRDTQATSILRAGDPVTPPYTRTEPSRSFTTRLPRLQGKEAHDPDPI